MTTSTAILLLFVAALVAANYPWLSNRLLFVFPEPASGKSGGFRLLEWCCNCALILLIGLGLERQINGVIHTQQWEFYAASILFFAVLAMPGFIIHYDFKRYWRRYQKQKRQVERQAESESRKNPPPA